MCLARGARGASEGKAAVVSASPPLNQPGKGHRKIRIFPSSVPIRCSFRIPSFSVLSPRQSGDRNCATPGRKKESDFRNPNCFA
jgi:hypothetical protein